MGSVVQGAGSGHTLLWARASPIPLLSLTRAGWGEWGWGWGGR